MAKRQHLFNVHKPGLLTTFQDLGRYGYQQYGIPVSGAMDPYALMVANILVGNPRHHACLEITWIGPVLEAYACMTIALTGADLEPKINGKVTQMWKTLQLKKGDILSFGKPKSGMRTYLSVKGGFQAPATFGSVAVDMSSGIGEKLAKHDRLLGFPGQLLPRQRGISDKPIYEKDVTVQVVLGPHGHLFSDEMKAQFFQDTFTVKPTSNRMGYGLTGDFFHPELKHDIYSDAVPFGGIQIPPNGEPIILMADRQTTGGYPRIGTVITTDLPKIAQLPPHGIIHFKAVSLEKAQHRMEEREIFLHQLERFCL